MGIVYGIRVKSINPELELNVNGTRVNYLDGLGMLMGIAETITLYRMGGLNGKVIQLFVKTVIKDIIITRTNVKLNA
jgi:hypothetical protein